MRTARWAASGVASVLGGGNVSGDAAGEAPAAVEGEQPPLVELDGVVRRFGKIAAVDGISLQVRRGELFCLLGPSGCGKSTTLRIIAGLDEPDDGRLVIGGRTIVDAKGRVSVSAEKRNIAFVFQSYAVWPHMTVAQNVAFPLKVRRQPRREIRRRVEDVLRLTGLSDLIDRPATALSGGQQQRVALARALVYQPQLLLLDEPMSNLDTKLRAEMRAEICRLRDELGLTIVFVTHDQDEAMAMSDRMAVMNAGRIEQVGTAASLYEHPETPFVRDFLGKVVSLPGTVSHVDGVLRVKLDASQNGEPLALVDGHRLGDHTRAVVVCRPEDLMLRPEPNRRPGVVSLSAQVVSASYLGSRIEYLLRVGETVVFATGPRREGVPVGAFTYVEFDARNTTVWPA